MRPSSPRSTPDSIIPIAAQGDYPIETVIAQKHTGLDHPDMVKLYRLVSEAFDWTADDPRIEDIADLVERLAREASQAGITGQGGLEDAFVDLLDTAATQASPVAERLHDILTNRG